MPCGVAVVGTLLTLLVVSRAHYTPTWAVHVPGGRDAADAVARDHGFVNLGEIFDHHYHFHHNSVSKRSVTPAHNHHDRLEMDARVRWAKQQKALTRKKRDFLPEHAWTSASSSYPSPVPSAASKRDAGSKRELRPARVKGRPRSADSKFQLNDPKWPHMWYLNRGGGLDMNVIPAWREGITGRGVVVTILDDGLETDHPDLIANYDPMASYDVNSHDADPQPRYDMIDSNRHGTRCAGEVAATGNNSLCAVGVAFEASVGGVRMLDGDVTDAVEARSLSLNPQHVDIYSASWGPDDDGKTVDGPGELATRAFIEGVTKGRNGKGSIFLWASGNGGREHDNCNCDGYTNSIWTLSISSATERGEVPWYSEKCSSTLAATYSSGAVNEKQVVTTDLHHSCTTGHTGTSASAPLAAGICALALQANKDLTWRDMQHIVVRTSRPERLSAGGEWRINGVGRNVSHSFGYGLLDAAGMVRMARTWKTVPPQRRCELAYIRPERPVPPNTSTKLYLSIDSCPGVNYLEHIQAKVTLLGMRRGDLRITLTSPAGTIATLLAPRPHDSSRSGFNSWPFMSVHTWGESPLGVWILEIINEGTYMAGPLREWEMIFYGTETPAREGDIGSMTVEPHSWYGAEKVKYGSEEVENRIEDRDEIIWQQTHSSREEGVRAAAASAGCLSMSAEPLFCLECVKGMHLYDGGCYASCPNGTYSSETAGHLASRRRNLTTFGEAGVKRRQQENNGSVNLHNSEAEDMLQVFKGDSQKPPVCVACHYTCATCTGPNSHHCTLCHADAMLTVDASDSSKHYCYTNTTLSQISEVGFHYNLNTALFMLSFFVCVVVIYCLFAFLIRTFCCKSSGGSLNNVAYNKLALDEKQRNALDIEEEINKAIDSTESESEDDLNL